MLRTSSFLTIALSLAAIGSATVPAAANPLTVFGGGSSHLAQLPSTAPVLTKPQASQEASHVLGPQKPVDPPPKIPTAAPVYSGLSPSGKLIPAQKYPAGDATNVTKGSHIPDKDLFCAKHPTVDFCHSGSSPNGGSSGGGSSGGGSSGGGRVAAAAVVVVAEAVAVAAVAVAVAAQAAAKDLATVRL